MFSKILIFVAMLMVSSQLNAKSKFLLPGEEEIRSRPVGIISVVILEDFLANSQAPAKILAIDTFEGLETALVERNEKLAMLVPEAVFDEFTKVSNTVMFAADSCQAECAGSAVAGAIAGGITGAGTGAEVGGSVGAAGGPGGAAAGAAGGALIGGSLGAVGGFIGGYEGCRILTECDKPKPTPAPEPDKIQGPEGE